MVPTGKVGPITPRKSEPEIISPPPYKEPAMVWERVDEGPNPYEPPVYKYTLLDFARKFGRRTLIPPPIDEYYKVKKWGQHFNKLLLYDFEFNAHKKRQDNTFSNATPAF